MSDRLPSLKPLELLRILQRLGFVIHRVSGSHHILKHPERPTVRAVIPLHDRELKRGTLMAIIKQAGLSVDDFTKR